MLVFFERLLRPLLPVEFCYVLWWSFLVLIADTSIIVLTVLALVTTAVLMTVVTRINDP